MVIPFSTFPISLAEQQIAYMAHPSSFVSTYTGNPIGTGPFKVKSWQVGVESQFVKNTGYWRKDSHGRSLPYLSGSTSRPSPTTRRAQPGPPDGQRRHDPPTGRSRRSPP